MVNLGVKGQGVVSLVRKTRVMDFKLRLRQRQSGRREKKRGGPRDNKGNLIVFTPFGDRKSVV